LTTDTKMLASTVQFSTYGREPDPITGAHPHTAGSTPKAGPREETPPPTRAAPVPSGPNSVPEPDIPMTTALPTHPHTNTPQRGHPHRTRRTEPATTRHRATSADVPPMSTHSRNTRPRHETLNTPQPPTQENHEAPDAP